MYNTLIVASLIPAAKVVAVHGTSNLKSDRQPEAFSCLIGHSWRFQCPGVQQHSYGILVGRCVLVVLMCFRSSCIMGKVSKELMFWVECLSLTFFTTFHSILLLLAFLLSVITVALTVFATQLDVATATYFGRTVVQCNFRQVENITCYCAQTEHAFNSTFGPVGDIECSNMYTRAPEYLVANATLSVGCLIVAVLISVSVLVCFLDRVCSMVCRSPWLRDTILIPCFV